jgi:hypothetical protein
MTIIAGVKMPTAMTDIQDACFDFFLYRRHTGKFIVSAVLNAPLEADLKARAKKVVMQEFAFAYLAAEASRATRDRTISRSRLFHKATGVIKAGGMNLATSKTRRYMIAKLNKLRTLHLNEADAIWVMLEGMKKADAPTTTEMALV